MTDSNSKRLELKRVFTDVQEAEKFRLTQINKGNKTRIVVGSNYTTVYWTVTGDLPDVVKRV